jgi:hypothetical protein
MFRFIGKILLAIWEELRPFYEEINSDQDPKTKLENELRILYGRGDLSKERFLEELNKLCWNQTSRGDILLLQQEARLRQRTQGNLVVAEQPNGELARGLERLYLDRGSVEELRMRTEEDLKALEKEMLWIREQVDLARDAAQTALPEEVTARAYLEVWQELLGLSRTFDVQREALSEDLRQLDLLDAGLRMQISETRIYQGRANFAELKLRIFQERYPRRSLQK